MVDVLQSFTGLTPFLYPELRNSDRRTKVALANRPLLLLLLLPSFFAEKTQKVKRLLWNTLFISKRVGHYFLAKKVQLHEELTDFGLLIGFSKLVHIHVKMSSNVFIFCFSKLCYWNLTCSTQSLENQPINNTNHNSKSRPQQLKYKTSKRIKMLLLSVQSGSVHSNDVIIFKQSHKYFFENVNNGFKISKVTIVEIEVFCVWGIAT